VSDDGPGVTPEARERLFQRLGQVGGDSQRPGTELGLYFCRLVVEAHGGTIGVDNRPGRGRDVPLHAAAGEDLRPAHFRRWRSRHSACGLYVSGP